MSRIQEGVEEQKVRHSRAKGQRGSGHEDGNDYSFGSNDIPLGE